MKNQAVDIEARSDEVLLIPLASVILKDFCGGAVSWAGTGRENLSCPIYQLWKWSSHLLLDVKLKSFVSCLAKKKKWSVAKYQVLS